MASSSRSVRPVYKPAANTKKPRTPLAQGRLIKEDGLAEQRKKPAFKGFKGVNDSTDIVTLVSPQKTISRPDEQRSLQQSPTLDLSDLDEACDRSVVVVDASGDLLNPDQSEVNCQVGLKKSPVRVVCHVETISDNELLNKDQLKVDSSRTNIPSTPPALSPVMKAPKSASRSRHTPLTKQVTTPRKTKPNYPQPNFDDSQDSVRNDENKAPEYEDDVQSIISDACSIDEYVPVIKSRSNMSSASSKSVTQKHKVKGALIPSRYMQATVKNTSTSKVKTSSSSSFSKQNVSSTKNRPVRPSSQARSVTPKMQIANKKHSAISVGSQPSTRALTPTQNNQSDNRKTSTPCSDTTAPAQDIDSEISAISVDLSSLSSCRSVNNSVLKKNRPKKQDLKTSQQRVDIMYARYLQWLYLSSKAKQVRKEQEKSAMSQLNLLWEEVEYLREREAKLKSDLVTLKHLNNLDDQLDLQQINLEPVVNNLPLLNKEYHELAGALDTTRHQINAKGVYIPEDEEYFQGELEEALKESASLLGEITNIVKQDVTRSNQFSNVLQTTQKLVDAEYDEMRKCTELLSAVQTLTTQESSLKIQAIQSQTSDNKNRLLI